MTTYTRNLVAEHVATVGYGWIPVPAAKGDGAVTAEDVAGWITYAKNVALFFVAPFIGLAYLLALPVIAVGMALWFAGKAAMRNAKVRTVALAIAAPFIGLAFVTVGPVIGLGALAWMGGRAYLKKA